ncbi:MAG TPA: YbaB/EbfC family nucleoid-associated protein [Gemmatimonadales bacterium]|nr:YbaB/EbfC family nucleoid-associated protein [Gemmatimonadales bacterium]
MPDFSQLLQLGQQVQGRLTQMQTTLTQTAVTGSAGGGMVQATADGRGQIRSIRIDPSLLGNADAEMLEDLVLAAVSEAQRRAEELYREELRKATGGLPLPFQLPL